MDTMEALALLKNQLKMNTAPVPSTFSKPKSRRKGNIVKKQTLLSLLNIAAPVEEVEAPTHPTPELPPEYEYEARSVSQREDEVACLAKKHTLLSLLNIGVATPAVSPPAAPAEVPIGAAEVHDNGYETHNGYSASWQAGGAASSVKKQTLLNMLNITPASPPIQAHGSGAGGGGAVEYKSPGGGGRGDYYESPELEYGSLQSGYGLAPVDQQHLDSFGAMSMMLYTMQPTAFPPPLPLQQQPPPLLPPPPLPPPSQGHQQHPQQQQEQADKEEQASSYQQSVPFFTYDASMHDVFEAADDSVLLSASGLNYNAAEFVYCPPSGSTQAAQSTCEDRNGFRSSYSSADRGKINFLFSKMDVQLRKQLRLDDEALYSCTDDKTADHITQIVLNLPHVSDKTLIIDGTACIGGNVISFAKVFKRVWAVEIDADRFELLQHNVAVTSSQGVSLFRADFLEFMTQQQEVKDAVVFLDPPWGGPAYHESPAVDLYMSKVNVADVCESLKQAHVRCVVIKAPVNFSVGAFKGSVSGTVCIHKNNLRKMLLVVVTYAQGTPKRKPKPHAGKSKKEKALMKQLGV